MVDIHKQIKEYGKLLAAAHQEADGSVTSEGGFCLNQAQFVEKGHFPSFESWRESKGYLSERIQRQRERETSLALVRQQIKIPLGERLKTMALGELVLILRQHAKELAELERELLDEELGVGSW
jgi:hypothetical protein